jgi:hypothetical protein
MVPVLSDVTAAEVESAPEQVRDLHQEILALAGSVLPVTTEVLALVAKYEAKGILVGTSGIEHSFAARGDHV